ncbi:MAG: hypothetical protein ACREJF_03495, partial [Candidatus Methylomirabilales bacterium]
MHNLRINGLGQLAPAKPFPIVETVGGVTGTGLLVGGLLVKKTAGTVMGVVGGVVLAGSVVMLVIKLAGGTIGAPGAPGAPLPTAYPPPPPPPPKPTDYGSQFNQYLE